MSIPAHVTPEQYLVKYRVSSLSPSTLKVVPLDIIKETLEPFDLIDNKAKLLRELISKNKIILENNSKTSLRNIRMLKKITPFINPATMKQHKVYHIPTSVRFKWIHIEKWRYDVKITKILDTHFGHMGKFKKRGQMRSGLVLCRPPLTVYYAVVIEHKLRNERYLIVLDFRKEELDTLIKTRFKGGANISNVYRSYRLDM